MFDILLTEDGDLYIGQDGDIALTWSIRQAVKLRLQWFFGEWRFAPGYGIPYFEEILVKAPDVERIRRIVRDETLSVDGVDDVRNIVVAIDRKERKAKVTFDLIVAEETFREEVMIW